MTYAFLTEVRFPTSVNLHWKGVSFRLKYYLYNKVQLKAISSIKTSMNSLLFHTMNPLSYVGSFIIAHSALCYNSLCPFLCYY